LKNGIIYKGRRDMSDWVGNSKSIYTCLGATNHSEGERQNEDYYATEPKALRLLLDEERFSKNVWECAVGEWHLANVLKEYGYKVLGSDILTRGNKSTEVIDFLNYNGIWDGDIITNPPYKFAKEFVEKALEIVPTGRKVAMFLKLTFLESKSRKVLFEKYPFKTLYVSSSRLQCAKNGDFETDKKGTGTAVAYGWYVWEKGYKCEPTIKWIN
jgi:hypothetical protein